MRRYLRITPIVIFLAFGGLRPVLTPGAPPPQNPGVIKTETNLVLVDVTVTGKDKEYLKDLEPNDFHIFEDGAEQKIVSFVREADIKPDAPRQVHYLVLLFDNTSLPEAADQVMERQAAAKFVETNASHHWLTAVLDLGDQLHVAQNFTANGDLLNQAVINPKAPAMRSNSGGGGGRGRLAQTDAQSATRNLLFTLRQVAEMLAPVPGRKVMILFAGGFPLDAETETDFQNTLDALNRANVGVYSVGAQGLRAPAMDTPPGTLAPNSNGQPRRQQAVRARRMGTDSGGREVALRTLSGHTGGFPILDTNDLLGGMETITEEAAQSYVLGYIPPTPTHLGSYHKIRVKVDRKGTEVRARDGYFDTKNPDVLAAKPEGMALEAHAAAADAGEIPVELAAPYFYVQPGVALVDLCLSIPGSALEVEKEKGELHSHLDVLAIAYREDGSVAARFSDSIKVDVGKPVKGQAANAPFAYQKCFKIAPGKYTLKVLLTAGGQKFGKRELPLDVSLFTGHDLTLGGPVFGDKILALAPRWQDLDPGLLENTKPLIANGIQIQPYAGTHFSKAQIAAVYLEVYEPLLKTRPVRLGVEFKIVDAKTTATVYSSSTIRLDQSEQEGNPLVPAAFRLPLENVPPGNYRIDFWSRDSAGNTSPVRSREISVE